MYRRILVAVEHSRGRPDDPRRTSRRWRSLTGAELLLVHVADGWAARHFDDLKLRESEEMKDDRAYLDGARSASCARRASRSRRDWPMATRRPS